MAKETKHITVEDVNKMFEDPPTRRFHVTLKGVSNKYEDGSERFPFTSIDDLDAKDVIRISIMSWFSIVLDGQRFECSQP
jgi:hypothetical protein